MTFSVIILAAGKGTRMKSSLPKVLHPIAGKPMVQRIIDTVSTLAPSSIHVVYGHGGDLLRQRIHGEHLTWCLQAEQLGTGHAVQQAAPKLSEDEAVMILVGDAPLIQASTLARLAEVKQGCDLALLTVELDDPTGMGRIIRNGDNIVAIVEHKDANENERAIKEINTGMMMMNAGDLKRWLAALKNDNAQGEFYLTDVIAMAAAEGKIVNAAHPETPEEVEGVNDRVQLARLERVLQGWQAEALMRAGVSLADPSRLDIRGQLQSGQDVSIDINVVIVGKVVLGNGVKVGAHATLIDCVIGDDVVIEPYTLIEGAVIDKQCTIGPYARLRPGTELKTGAKVGNFVEMKKTVLGEGAKANHLTYLGDATVGAGANIGAGTITCNYDGVNKSHTNIGANAFIGSNSALVAPVHIGDGATVGAGSVITNNVSDDALAVARGKQREIVGWQRPKKKS